MEKIMTKTYIVQLQKGTDKSILEPYGEVGNPVALPHIVILEADESVIDQVVSLEQVVSVEEDSLLQPDDDVDVSADNWFLCAVQEKSPDCQSYQHTLTGKGVDLYIIDDGVRGNHKALQNNFVETIRSHDENEYKPSDSHGTRVAGAAVAPKYGPAVDANVFSLRTDYSLREIVKSYDKLLDHYKNKQDKNPAILNCSYGGSFENSVIGDILQELKDNGIIIVCSAGNYGNTEKVYPAAYSSTLSVGALKDNGDRADFSTYGEWVDLWAPGRSGKLPTSISQDSYTITSGTSFSSPLVAGIIALYLEGSDRLDSADTVDKVLEKFKQNAVDENGHVHVNFSESYDYEKSKPEPKPEPKPKDDDDDDDKNKIIIILLILGAVVATITSL